MMYDGYLCRASLRILLFLLAGVAMSNVRRALADCTELLCTNGAQCGYEPGTNTTLTCLCPPSYCGDHCQFQSPCQNGGSCVSTTSGSSITLSCDCPGNFTGQRCEYLHACSSSPCPPDRRCEVDIFNNYRCECMIAGYFGQHCDIFNKCYESPCQNNSTCIFTGSDSYRCACNPDGTITGYYGTDCELFDLCLTSPCGTGGTCLQDPLGGGTNITCVCDEQRYGDVCQHEDRCISSPCRNNGICCRLETGDYECDCPEGYLGKTCFLSVCDLYFCRNNGTCNIDSQGHPKCRCPDEFYGLTCESLNPCLKYDLCRNGGNCTDVVGDSYACACPDGWTGARCNFEDPCVSNPCHENQTCVLHYVAFGVYTCNCNSVGYFGTFCTDYDSCTDMPCQNGGRCVLIGNMRYECDCIPDGFPTGYYGTNCQYRRSCPQEVPGGCSYHGQCEYTDREPGYVCVRCDDGYYGTACERYDSCHSNPCLNGQPCISLYLWQKHYCNCSVQYSGDNCETRVTCNGEPSSTTVSTKGVYFWPETLIKQSVSLSCEVGGGHATRRCEAVVAGVLVLAIFWVSPDTSECQTVNFTKEVAQNMTYYLIHTTSNAEDMREEEVSSSTDLLLAIIIYAYLDHKLANDIMLCISNLLDVNETILRDSSVESETNTKLLSVIDSYAENTVLGFNDSWTELVTDNIEIKIQDVSMEQALATGSAFYSSLPESNGVSIRVPAEAFASGDLARAAGGIAESIRVNFVVMANTKLFIGTDGPTESNSGYAVSASILGKAVNGLVAPVTIALPLEGVSKEDAVERTPRCAFWNEEEGKWDTTGLELISTENNSAVCESSHLTYFAVIMDPGLSDAIPANHVMILSVITKVGISVTLLGLLLTFISYLLFKQLRGTRSGKILIHLCASLFSLNLVFLIDSVPALTASPAVCLACAILLHYFVLTSFSWMGMEAVNMYRALVQVFVRGSTGCFMNKCIIVSWGVPIVLVTATVAMGPRSHYGKESDMCLVLRKNPYVYYISYLGPCCIILASNIIVFAMVIHAVCSCRSKKRLGTAAPNMPRRGVRKTQIGCALSVTFLLGLTWVFGLFALGEATLAFQYIFTILNTMQGFFIFLFRCALYPEAVRCWRLLLTQRTLNPRKTPSNTAVKNNTQHSQKTNSSKLLPVATNYHPKPVVSVVSTGYVPEKTGAQLLRFSTIQGQNNRQAVDSYEEINTWGQAMKLRNVTLNDIKPRNDI